MLGAETFHPNKSGYNRLLSSVDPTIDSTLSNPDPAPTDPNLIRTTAAVAPGVHVDNEKPREWGETYTVAVTGRPRDVFTVVGYSLPVRLASGVLDSNGMASVQVTVPVGMYPGVHRVDVYDITAGTTIGGELLAVHAPSGCFGESPDLDGDGVIDSCDPNSLDGPFGDPDRDGIPNNSDNCQLVANVAQTSTIVEGVGDVCAPGSGYDFVARAANSLAETGVTNVTFAADEPSPATPVSPVPVDLPPPTPPGPAPSATPLLPGGAAEYVPVPPARLADTRTASQEGVWSTSAPCTVRVPVAGRAGVPANATAAVLTITVDAPAAAGWAAVYPAATAFTGISNLNFAAGEIRANSAIVQLGAGGDVDVRMYAATCDSPVIVDVTGAFVPTTSYTGHGRFVSTGVNRVSDTRNGAGPVAAGGVTTLSAAELGIPADATAVALNITVADTSGPGFVAAYPAGTTRGRASTLNSDSTGQIRAGFTIQPVSATGLAIYQYMGANLIVDVVGYMSGQAPTDSGAYVPAAPRRVVDTRPDRVDPFASTTWAGVTGARAVVANWTITESSSAGWVAVRPSNATGIATTSTVNASIADDNVANLAITPLAADGVTAQVGYTRAAVIADYAGYFTG